MYRCIDDFCFSNVFCILTHSFSCGEKMNFRARSILSLIEFAIDKLKICCLEIRNYDFAPLSHRQSTIWETDYETSFDGSFVDDRLSLSRSESDFEMDELSWNQSENRICDDNAQNVDNFSWNSLGDTNAKYSTEN